MKLNIGDVEDYIKVFENNSKTKSISFGKRPNKKVFTDHKNINCIINVQAYVKRDAEPWYMKQKESNTNNIQQYLHFNLEHARKEEDDLENASVILNKCLKTALNWFSKLKNVHLFIHGFESNRFACILALLIWHRLDKSIDDPLQKLYTTHFMSAPYLKEDYPVSVEYKELLVKLLKNYNSSLYKYMEQAKPTKKIKLNLI